VPISQSNPLDATSRRRFLTNAAGVAAGSALALATVVSAKADTAAPVAAVASSGPDPIFAAITMYRAALQVRAAAQDEYDRRRAMVREDLGQSDPCICIADMSKYPAFRSSVMQQAYSIEQIDELCPRDKYPDLNKLHRQLFRKLAGKHKSMMGDVERVLSDTYQPLEDSSAAFGQNHADQRGGRPRTTGIVAGTAARARYGRRPACRYHNLRYRRFGRHTSECAIGERGDGV
jgi:hypothetical protein